MPDGRPARRRLQGLATAGRARRHRSACPGRRGFDLPRARPAGFGRHRERRRIPTGRRDLDLPPRVLHPDLQAGLELHFHLYDFLRDRDAFERHVRETSIRLEVEGVSLPVPTREFDLILDVAHLVNHDFALTLKHLLDVAVKIHRWRSTLDWQRVEQGLDEVDLRPEFGIAVSLVEQLFGVEPPPVSLPADVIDATVSWQRAVRRYLEQIERFAGRVPMGDTACRAGWGQRAANGRPIVGARAAPATGVARYAVSSGCPTISPTTCLASAASRHEPPACEPTGDIDTRRPLRVPGGLRAPASAQMSGVRTVETAHEEGVWPGRRHRSRVARSDRFRVGRSPHRTAVPRLGSAESNSRESRSRLQPESARRRPPDHWGRS